MHLEKKSIWFFTQSAMTERVLSWEHRGTEEPQQQRILKEVLLQYPGKKKLPDSCFDIKLSFNLQN